MDDLPLGRVMLPAGPLAYRVQGQGPDVILLHGWMSSSRMWRGLMDALASRFRCHALDLPGHGDTPFPSDSSPTLATYRVAVQDYCAARKIRPFAVIGHSMGALVALSLALECPGWMDRAVLLAPPVRGRLVLRLDALLRTRAGRDLFRVVHPIWGWLVLVGMPLVFDLLPVESRVKRAAMRRKVEDARRASWQATVESVYAILGTDYAPRLSDVQTPALIMVGAWDITVPPSEGACAAAQMPHARLVRIPRVAHQVTDEAPALVHRQVLDFLCAAKDTLTDG